MRKLSLLQNMNKELAIKLFELQKRLKPIVKDVTNPFFKSKYFDMNGLLSEIKPHLTELKLIIIQPLTNVNGRAYLDTEIIDAETGEEITRLVPLPEGLDAQKFGAAVSYYRRYSLTSLLLVESEDDDGNSLVERTKIQPPEKSSYDIALLAIEKLNPNPLSSTRDIMDMAKRINDSLTLTPGQKAELLKKLQTQ